MHTYARRESAAIDLAHFASPSIDSVISDHRMEICSVFYFAGPEATLDAIGAIASIVANYVLQGRIEPADAFDPLQEVAENLGLVRRYGQDTVQAALAHGVDECWRTH